MASAARIWDLNSTTLGGRWASRSWLKTGIPSRLASSIVVSAGSIVWAASKRRRLYDSRRRLPGIPKILTGLGMEHRRVHTSGVLRASGREGQQVTAPPPAAGRRALDSRRAPPGMPRDLGRGGSEPPVVVLGAGYAGLRTAQELHRRTRGRVPILLVDRHPVHVLRTELYEVGRIAGAGGASAPWAIPLDEFLRRTSIEFRPGTATEIDLEHQRVQLEAEPLAYSQLVIALGSVAAYYQVPGAAEHTHSVYRFTGAQRLAAELKAIARRSVDLPGERRPRVIVVGGGSTGTELAAEIAGTDWGASPGGFPPARWRSCWSPARCRSWRPRRSSGARDSRCPRSSRAFPSRTAVGADFASPPPSSCPAVPGPSPSGTSWSSRIPPPESRSRRPPRRRWRRPGSPASTSRPAGSVSRSGSSATGSGG